MALVIADRVKETSTTAGTGTVVLAGASAGYVTNTSLVLLPNDTAVLELLDARMVVLANDKLPE